MSIAPMDIPLACMPLDQNALERQVLEMEGAVALLRRRDEAAAALKARGIEFVIDTVKPADIFAFVAARRNCSVDEIRSKDRRRVIVYARHEVFYLMLVQKKPNGDARWSTTDIGRRVAAEGTKPFDHTTTIYGGRRHEDRITAAAAGVLPTYKDRGPRPGAGRTFGAPLVAPVVCMLPPNETCPGCGALAGEPCNDGARRG